jgi:hypothetical protein
MLVTTIYPIITMPGIYSGLRALLWHFSGYYDIYTNKAESVFSFYHFGLERLGIQN